MCNSSRSRSSQGRISWRRAWSSEASGSSSSRMRGLVARARAIATRWRSPPESSLVRRASRWPMPSSSTTSSSRLARRRAAGALAAVVEVAGARPGGRTGWLPGTRSRAAVARRAGTRFALSSCQQSPADPHQAHPGRRSRPATQRSSVVLPEPDGPNSAVMPRGRQRRSTSSAKLGTRQRAGERGSAALLTPAACAVRRLTSARASSTAKENSTMAPASQCACAYSSASTWP